MLIINADIVSAIDFRALFGNTIMASVLDKFGIKYIPDLALTWLLEKFAETYGIKLVAVEVKEVGKILSIAVSIGIIDAKKIVALAMAKMPATLLDGKIVTSALIDALGPHTGNILDALFPALPGVISALDGFIKDEAAIHGITLSNLKVSVKRKRTADNIA
jgi:hypothetical protein